MKISTTFAFVATALTVGNSCWAQAPLPATTAIDEYVHRPDDAYEWKIVNRKKVGTTTTLTLGMTSQNWLTKEQVDRTTWKHWVNVAIPEKVASSVGFLMISGGSNGGDAPEAPASEIIEIARATGTVAAELKMVPNQALVFHGDGVRRKEDDLIGYTWDQFLETGDAEWLARNAMIKSAVRAMDTVTAACANEQVKVDEFVVAGASKRGWTTWLTGAIDDRVVGIIPIVIDVLNVRDSMRHHFSAYGYWAPAVGNYVDHGIMERFNDPRLADLYNLVDPYFYRHRLEKPKLVLNAAGDQFFLPDSWKFYWDDLPGEKYVRYVPNTDHGMRGSDAITSVVAFHGLLAHGKARPDFDWSISESGEIVVTTKDTPESVVLWQATNPEARDFRLETLGPKYTSTELTASEDGKFRALVDAPDQGWTAYFVELKYDVGMPVPLKLSTGVNVLPKTLPYPDRDPSKPASVTIRCVAQDAAAAKAIEVEAGQLFPAVLKNESLETAQDESVLYLNWAPDDFREEAGKVTSWLESKGIEKVNYQLESGRIITKTQ